MKTNPPTIQIYARPVGYLQWVCPNCHEIFGAQQIPWRKARVTCTGCNRSYRLGLGFIDKTIDLLPPYTARTAQWQSDAVNTLNDVPVSRAAIARMRGRLDWICPQCHAAQSGQIGREFMDITCGACGAFFTLYVILYRASAGVPTKTPIDWVLPAYEYTKNSLSPLAASPLGAIK